VVLACAAALSCAGPHGAEKKGACPRTSGAAMVRVDSRYCIDEAEVTQADYAAWLATKPSAAAQAPACAWNEDFAPRCEWPPAGTGDRAVVCVDWCDAAAYCRGVGKRLCGRIGGGANAFEAWMSPSGQWFTACEGRVPEAARERCNGLHRGKRRVGEGPAKERCVTSDGAADLLGNVWEWEDSCIGSDGRSDRCRLRGGSFLSAAAYLTCRQPAEGERAMVSNDIGFRCCAP
jgi:formylglycine-generating enzyme required for sulfatase activity